MFDNAPGWYLISGRATPGIYCLGSTNRRNYITLNVECDKKIKLKLQFKRERRHLKRKILPRAVRCRFPKVLSNNNKKKCDGSTR